MLGRSADGKSGSLLRCGNVVTMCLYSWNSCASTNDLWRSWCIFDGFTLNATELIGWSALISTDNSWTAVNSRPTRLLLGVMQLSRQIQFCKTVPTSTPRNWLTDFNKKNGRVNISTNCKTKIYSKVQFTESIHAINNAEEQTWI